MKIIPSRIKRPVIRDALAISAATLIVLSLFYLLDMAEIWGGFAEAHEAWEVDEIPFALAIMSFGLVGFALRRSSEYRAQVVETKRAVLQLRSEIEQRRQTEAALKQAQCAAEAAAAAAFEASRAKSEFLANMSHEIRTPLNGVLGMASLVRDTTLDSEQRECVETITQSGEALLNILNDILDFSKIEAGKLELETLDFDLVDTIASAVELMAPQAHGKGLEIPTYVSPAVPRMLRGDDGRLRQILLNLLSNAVKFTQRGGVSVEICVELSAVSTDHVMLRFEVADTGIGVPDEMQQRIFEEFSQADGSVTRHFGGTGLGLAICQRLVGLMGGEIGMTPRDDGGSLFWFTVRLEQVAGAEPWGMCLAPDLAGCRVLVVDDNPVNRRIFEKQLAALGLEVTLATGADSALVKLGIADAADQPFDVAIIDHMMPGTDGIDLAAMIRDDSAQAGMKLVLSSSSGERNALSGARQRGFDAALPKPLRPGALLHCLNLLFDAGARDGEPAATEASGEPELARASARILLAEDNQVNQKVMAAVLGKLGYAVDVAANGIEAIDALRKIKYDLVLMDVQMPEVDGLEATRRIRALADGLSGVPIIGVTAHAMKGDRERVFEAGMDDYISKPVDLKQLAAKIAHWLRERSDRSSDAA